MDIPPLYKKQYQSRIIYKQIQNVPAKIQTYFVVEAIKRQPYKQINLFIWLVYRLLRDFISQYSSSLKSTTYIDYQLVMCRCMTVGKTNYAI